MGGAEIAPKAYIHFFRICKFCPCGAERAEIGLCLRGDWCLLEGRLIINVVNCEYSFSCFPCPWSHRHCWC